MRRAVIFVAVLSACFAIGSAGARVSAQVVARSTVTALSADGNDVAYAAARTKLDCDRVFIWQRLTGRTFQLGKRQRCAPRVAPIDSVAVSGGRALWLTSTSGKVVNWQLWTATTTKRTPRLVQFVMRQPTDPRPILIGSAGGGLLPYALDTTVTVCEVERVNRVHMECGGPRRRARRPRLGVLRGGGAAGDRVGTRGKIVSVNLYAQRRVRGRGGDEGPGRPA